MSSSSGTINEATRGWLTARGEMGALIAQFPWEQTPLGPISLWPASLRFTVNFMLRAAGAMAVIWGDDHRLLYNDAYAAVIQTKHPAALGQPAAEVFAEIWPVLQPLFAQALAGNAVLSEDLPLSVIRNGRAAESFFSFTYNPVEDEQGQVRGFVAVVIETTARVLQEQERAHVFDTTLSAIADFAYTFDLKGRFTYANQALLSLFGLGLSEVVGKNFFDLNLEPELAQRLHRQIQEVITHKCRVRDETVFYSAQGQKGYYEYIFSPVFNAEGAVSVVAGSTREITERRTLQLRLQDVMTRMEATLSAGAVGTWTWDLRSNQLHADRTLAEYFFLTPQEAQAAPAERYLAQIHPDDVDRVRDVLYAAIREGSLYQADYRVVDRGGSGAVRWLGVRGVVERDESGAATALPGVAHDITLRKELEHELRQAKAHLEAQADSLEEQVRERTLKLQETVAELESLTYSISHDLRGPLRSMHSFAEALQEDCGDRLGPVAEDYVRRIVAAAGRMDKVTQDVLVYTRLAQKEVPLEKINLAEFVPSLIDTYHSQSSVPVDIQVDAALPMVWATQANLTQCLANLVGNAVKFVPAGRLPTVRISGTVRDGRAFIAIADNGIGIPAPQLESIFRPFYRLAAAYEGTGIGLAVVKRAVERMGGRITVASELDVGSVFTLELAAAASTLEG